MPDILGTNFENKNVRPFLQTGSSSHGGGGILKRNQFLCLGSSANIAYTSIEHHAVVVVVGNITKSLPNGTRKD